MTSTVKCPTCQKLVSWTKDSEFRPFCCERCQLIDLGEWASENRSIQDNDSNTKWQNNLDDKDPNNE